MIREILVIMMHEIKLVWRSKRVLLAGGIVLLASILMSTTMIKISQSKGFALLTAVGETGMQQTNKKKVVKALSGFFGKRTAIVEYRMETPLLSIAAVLILLFFPFLIALLGYDAMSSEIQGGSIRFMLPRARRASILLGKFAAQAMLLLILLMVGYWTIVLSGLYAFQGPTAMWFKVASSMALLSWVMSLGYLGWVMLASSLVRRPFIGLLLSIAGLLAMGIVGLTKISMISPNFYKFDILGPPDMAWQAGGIYVGMAAVTVGLAIVILQARDL